jgi:CRISPR-associated endonuclease/helicase Cas3
MREDRIRFYAHTDPADAGNVSKWEPLFTPDCQALSGGHCDACARLDRYHGHLNKVAWWTAKFAAEMFPGSQPEARNAPRQWGWLAGLWHDLGKFSDDFQTYLRKSAAKSDPHRAETEAGPTGKVDHSTAGAKYANGLPPFGPLLAYLIAGHHAGLPDAVPLFQTRLRKNPPPWEKNARAFGLPGSHVIPCPPLASRDLGMPGMAFLLRMLFSCLVDADFLATEAFMSPGQASLRETWRDDILTRMADALETHLSAKFPVLADPVNAARAEVRRACLDAAAHSPGFFSLTVPTGGGKTLSSLAFALRHALAHGLRRIIYVIPYTSITEQNADVFREAFAELSKEMGREIVLEHHSNLDPDHESVASRLVAENWDVPLVVTTSVQFFQSLYANRSKPCRRLHNVAGSVVILDEAQSLPVRLLSPILTALRSLVHDFRSTVVFCTATQPALEKRQDFIVGIPSDIIREIVQHRQQLFTTLRRTKTKHLGKLDDDALLQHILPWAKDGCLLIVNTTKAARELHDRLKPHTPVVHLSARMCPVHRSEILAKVRARSGQPIIAVSTQLIEAGVDISFPTVFRAECGLDSFAQAAGRCNRHGELGTGLDAQGRVFFFQPVDHPIPRQLADLVEAAGITRAHILETFAEDELLSLEAIRAYFEFSIWQAGPRTNRWDEPGILSHFGGGNSSRPFEAFAFQSAADAFQMIPQNTRPIIIPWGREGRALRDELHLLEKQGRVPSRVHHRRAQRFTIQIQQDEWTRFSDRIDPLHDGAFPVLIHPENDYSEHTGLKSPTSPGNPDAFYCGA